MKKDASSVRILGVHLVTGRQTVRVGSLLRDPNGSTKFVVDESYVDLGPARPVLSLGWHFSGDEERTIAALRRADDKIGRGGGLPTWFSHLLPEGALRDLIVASFGWKGAEELDLLAELGVLRCQRLDPLGLQDHLCRHLTNLRLQPGQVAWDRGGGQARHFFLVLFRVPTVELFLLIVGESLAAGCPVVQQPAEFNRDRVHPHPPSVPGNRLVCEV